MTILIAEDDDHKYEAIRNYIIHLGRPSNAIIRARTASEFAARLDSRVTVCVIDLRIPSFEGAQPDQNGIGILQTVDLRSGGRVKVIAISSFPEEFEDLRTQFESRGCILVDYTDKDTWQNALKTVLVQDEGRYQLDFLIVCALQSEAVPYIGIPDIKPSNVRKGGMSRTEITISGRNGAVMVLPRMGLVEAAIGASIAMDRFRPSLVAMSGICAGFSGKVKLGQILVPDICYEYQTGKWTDDGFSQEPYQVPASDRIVGVVKHVISDDDILDRLEMGLPRKYQRPSLRNDPATAVFTSGSAVIANEEYINQVATHHRKVSGLDMEAYALYRSASLSQSKPEFFCAKTVVDLGGESKNDDLQPYGCYVSAKLTVEIIKRFFHEIDAAAEF